MAGFYTSHLGTKPIPALLASSLQASYGNGGSGFFGAQRTPQGIAPEAAGTETYYTSGAGAGSLATQSGTWTDGDDYYGPGLYPIKTTVTGSYLQFTLDGRYADVYWESQAGASHWEYSIDGGAYTQVTDPGTTGTVRKTTVDMTTAGAHTLRVRFKAGSTGEFHLWGVDARNNTGVAVHNLAWAGNTAANMKAMGNIVDDTNGGATFPTDLLIYPLGYNDISFTTGTTDDDGDAIASYFENFFYGIKENDSDVDVILLVYPRGNYDDTTLPRWASWAATMRGVAEAIGAAYVNADPAFGSWANANALGYWGNAANPAIAGTDDIHFSDAGADAIADLLLPIITAG